VVFGGIEQHFSDKRNSRRGLINAIYKYNYNLQQVNG